MTFEFRGQQYVFCVYLCRKFPGESCSPTAALVPKGVRCCCSCLDFETINSTT